VHYWDGLTWFDTKLEALQWSLTRKLSGYSPVTGNLPPTNPTYGEYQTGPCTIIIGPEVGYGGRGRCQTFFPPTNAFVDYEDGWVTAECEPTIAIIPLKSTSTKIAPLGEWLPFKAKVLRNGNPVYGRFVTVTLVGANPPSTAGYITDMNGEFHFTYEPPAHPKTDLITAVCDTCTNTAEVTVEAIGANMCSAAGYKRQSGTVVGNPISVTSGEKLQVESDWKDGGAHPLDFVRNYRSGGVASDARLGSHWSHNYTARLIVNADNAVVHLGNGDFTPFTRANATSPWLADSGVDTLVEQSGGVVFTSASDESRWLFDSDARLVSIAQRNGWTYSLSYSQDRLASVTNAFNRVLQLGYDASGRLASVTPPGASGPIAFSYDSANRITGASYPGGTSKGYVYENASYPNALTGLIDESGQRFATFGYDAIGRANSTVHAGGAQGYNVDYSGSPSRSTVASGLLGTPVQNTARTVVVTDALGTQQTVSYKGASGNLLVTGSSNAAGGAQVASRIAGAANLPSQETDFLGNNTTYTWDAARQLPLTVTKAATQAVAQTTSTQWHPTWRLPSLVTESDASNTPLRSTAYSYDLNGSLLSQTTTEIATSRMRTTQWTYGSNGLAQTMTDPRNNVWTFGYDSQGNRTSVTNPLSQVTTYAYDGAGYVTSMTDPNGVATSYVYDARQRLQSVTTGTQTTGYTYWPTGQLKRITFADGAWLDYAYDAAQRLNLITDKLGNRIEYTLDGMGNRTGEQVKDVAGVLRRQIQRSVNALNRLQQVTGEF
jgi:YD repeat-containing protein